MRILIIGGGTAGTSAATKLRRLNENDEIIIFEKNDNFAVSNCGLNHYLSGKIKKINLIGASIEMMKQLYNIDVYVNSEVIAINRENQTISIKNQADQYYDKLIITVGASQLRPDISGILNEKIFTIYDLASVNRIKNYIKSNSVKKAIVLGGGYIGIEFAESLYELNIKTTVVEKSSHILPSVDYDIAATLQNAMREKGVNLYLNTSINSFEDQRATLSNGETIDYDVAIIATGSKPDLKLSILADLEIGESGGVKVNEYMQTSDKNIYAAGDEVEVIDFVTHKPLRMAQANLAIKQAQIIADNIAGLNSEFKYALNTAITQVFDYNIASVGANEKTLKENAIEYHKVLLYDGNHAGYLPNSDLMLLKLLFNADGKILGAQGIGKEGLDKRMDIMAIAIKSGDKVEDLQNIELCYAPAFGTGKDAVNNLGSMAVNVLQKRAKFIAYEEIDWHNFNNDTLIIDVRPPESFTEGHIPNAINIPLEAIRNNLAAIPQDKKVILYCNRGYKAYIASCILTNNSFNNIYMLSGSEMLYSEIIHDKISSDSQQNQVHKIA